ncbi:hypothetical protein VOLCADRAFT_93804 [Volvox carteri f. nagariensis]|uniref:Uncharacterized protein n=1 Tax=Volvox carteri f. nagariensis TaxID=3068 RepID=D8U338_VOLCA|nr:uncharacterized protein VOLCADRAFT_93804 [Volvox carteri f. nagariensis]EFJ46008.1 hypothetical protein VOLCADRAFT_93804 [Volvox carteri f. nagariensis]|eukprot:XP_002953086.1 hypothetical protein VOLCADRAFT_93804 [Volvox carteri f. nagariensis]
MSFRESIKDIGILGCSAGIRSTVPFAASCVLSNLSQQTNFYSQRMQLQPPFLVFLAFGAAAPTRETRGCGCPTGSWSDTPYPLNLGRFRAPISPGVQLRPLRRNGVLVWETVRRTHPNLTTSRTRSTGSRGLLGTRSYSRNHNYSYSRIGRSGAGRCFASSASWGPGGDGGSSGRASCSYNDPVSRPRPSVAQTLVRWRGVVVAGRDIDRVARLHRENPAMPTIYHIFSTGGFIHAGTMWRWMDEVEDVAQRRDMLEEELSYGMAGWQGPLLNGVRTFMQSYLQSKGVKMRTEEVYDAWYNLAPVCPQLYLYSDADPLVSSSDVERYMGVQEGRGVEVSGYKWPDSGHVEHFRRHPHEYAYQISTFLARSLRDW